MNLRTLTDKEFLRYANAQVDDLTSSDVERELLRRFEMVDTEIYEAIEETGLCAADLRQLENALEGYTPSEIDEFVGVLRDSGFGAKTATEFFKLFEKAGITEPDEFEAVLKLADQFRKLANDAGDLFTRLHTLTEETQED